MITILTEATESIGTGHVMESFSLIESAMSLDLEVELWINRDAPTGLIDRSPCNPNLIDNYCPDSLITVLDQINGSASNKIVTNFRNVNNAQVDLLKKSNLPVVCIDDFGNRQLNCDVIINSTFVQSQQQYSPAQNEQKIYYGPEYLVLSTIFQEYHDIPRVIKGPIRNIIVSMGGSDPRFATLRITDILAKFFESVHCDVVVGAAFRNLEALEAIISNYPEGKFKIHQNVSDLPQMFFNADLGLTAGGNTLSEMACVGTPSIVLFDECHEGRQGDEFQKAGATYCLGQASQVAVEKVIDTVLALNNPLRRRELSDAGRGLVDGKGAERVLDILDQV